MQNKSLSSVTSFNVDSHVRQCAINLKDEYLIAKLSSGDMIASGAVYHAQCLSNLYRKNKSLQTQPHTDDTYNYILKSAFAELISYIEYSLEIEGITPVFKLSELKKLYCDRIKELGGDAGEVHSTRLKHLILSNFPELDAYTVST